MDTTITVIPVNTTSPDWHPVAPAHELLSASNIVAGFAAGAEMALWRSAQGVVQAWDNRCPHRGVRLTLGRVMGDRLVCGYHGWEYAADSGQCAHVPAHPTMVPPRNVCVKSYRAVESAGMIWVTLAGDAAAPVPAPDAAPAGRFCRTVPMRVPTAALQATLTRRGFAPDGHARWRGRLADTALTVFVQQARAALSFLHVWTDAQPESDASDPMPALLAALQRLRLEIEAGAPARET